MNEILGSYLSFGMAIAIMNGAMLIFRNIESKSDFNLIAFIICLIITTLFYPILILITIIGFLSSLNERS